MLINIEVANAIWPDATALAERLRGALDSLDGSRVVVGDVSKIGPDQPLLSDEYGVGLDVMTSDGAFVVGWKLGLRDGTDDGQPGKFGLVVEVSDAEGCDRVYKLVTAYTDDVDALKADIVDHDITEDVEEVFKAVADLSPDESLSP